VRASWQVGDVTFSFSGILQAGLPGSITFREALIRYIQLRGIDRHIRFEFSSVTIFLNSL